MHLLLFLLVAILSQLTVGQDPPPVFDLPPPPIFSPPGPAPDEKPSDASADSKPENVSTTPGTPSIDVQTQAEVVQASDVTNNVTVNSTDIPSNTTTESYFVNSTNVNITALPISTSNNKESNVTKGDILSENISNATLPQEKNISKAISTNESIIEVNTESVLETRTSNETSNTTIKDKQISDTNVTVQDHISNTNATDEVPRSETLPVAIDLPPPPPLIPLPPAGLLSAGTNEVTDSGTQNEVMNAVLQNGTIDGNITSQNATTTVDSVEERNRTSDKMPSIVSIDLPPPPIPDDPSINILEAQGSTTIEISTVLKIASTRANDQVITSDSFVEPEINTPAMNIVNATITNMNTTTDIMPVTEQQPQLQTAAAPVKRMPRPVSNVIKDFAPLPDHPPPIFVGKRLPPGYAEPADTPLSRFPGDPTRKPATTTEPPPPPIFVPHIQKHTLANEVGSKSNVPSQSNVDHLRDMLTQTDPRYMNPLELAQLMHSVQSRGPQTFFPPEPEPSTTTTEMPSTVSTTTTILTPTLATTPSLQSLNRQIPDFLKRLYAEQEKFTKPTVQTSTAIPLQATQPRPVQSIIDTTNQNQFFDVKYLLEKYVLNASTSTTTSKPTVPSRVPVKPVNKGAAIPAHKPTFSPQTTSIKEQPLTVYITESPLVFTTSSLPKTQKTTKRFYNIRDLLAMIVEPDSSLNLSPTQANSIAPELPQIAGQVVKNEQLIHNLNELPLKTEAVNQINRERTSTKPQPKPVHQGGAVETISAPLTNGSRQPLDNTHLPSKQQYDINSNGNRQIEPLPQPTETRVPPPVGGDFRPRDHIYGSTQFQNLPDDPSNALKQRLNRKWSLPESQDVVQIVEPALPQVVVQSEVTMAPVTEQPVLSTTKDTNVRSLFERIFNIRLTPRGQERQEPQIQPVPTAEQQLKQREKEQQRQLFIEEQRRMHQLQVLLEAKRAEEEHRLMQLRLERQRLQQHASPAQNQQAEFPLAKQVSTGEIRQFPRESAPQLSSINIFSAPAWQRSQRRLQTPRTKIADEQPSSETRWRAQPALHGHMPVPYKVNSQVPENTTFQTTTVPDTARQHVDISIFQESLQTQSQTVAPTTRFEPMTMRPVTRRRTTTIIPTVPPTADPNPPPIFGTKVQVTFMPMPKIDPVTDAPKVNKTVVTNGDSRCSGCVFVNDRCLLPHAVHCNEYIECVRQGASVRAFTRNCALGSFFNRRSFLCVDPKNADCPTDRCREPGLKWYGVNNHCKHYWSCVIREGGSSYAQNECCPDMGGFVEGEGCVENPNCTDSCTSKATAVEPTGCQLRKTASSSVYFDVNANIERPCAPGTLFNERACTCVQDVTIERSENRPGVGSCLPKLSLVFNGSAIEDTSGTRQHVGVEGLATSQAGEGISNGAGRLVVWRYANLMFPVVFAMRLRFLSTTKEPRFQTLVSNCDKTGGTRPSLEISIDTRFQEVIFRMDTYEGPPKLFKIMYQHGQWTEVDFIYDGERLVGSVNGRARNIFAAGGIETRTVPVSIGACGVSTGLKGLLDDIHFYEDCIPDELYGVFLSVLE